MEMHSGVCKSCGGMVDGEGYSMGGEIGVDTQDEGMTPDIGSLESGQRESTEMLRGQAFSDALHARMSRRGMDESTPETPAKDTAAEDDEMTEMKKAKYGFMRRR